MVYLPVPYSVHRTYFLGAAEQHHGARARRQDQDLILFGREAIPHARLGQQVARTGGITLQLAAQVGHVDTHVMCRVGVGLAPDLLQ
jgi:hypothetical protein